MAKQKKPKHVTIVGTGHGWQLVKGDEGEIWCMNDLGISLPGVSMIWDMHDFEWTLQENYENYSHVQEDLTPEDRWTRAVNRDARFRRIEDFCNETGCRLMTIKKYKHVPSSIAYPLKAVLKRFPACREFLNSALSQALSYALYKKYTNIDLVGINVEMGTEWIYQRDCVSYWIGVAHGMGVRCTVSGSTRRPMRIVDKKIYGFGIKQSKFGEEKIVASRGIEGKPVPIVVVDERGEEW